MIREDLIEFLHWCLKNNIDLSFTDDCPEGIVERYLEEKVYSYDIQSTHN